ncbi:hypothetical protein GF371_00295 [Candidatus Woesearchaeota archaeon]|nr:hypothetical protein [Candidatus Woesearchaeota archaeon]
MGSSNIEDVIIKVERELNKVFKDVNFKNLHSEALRKILNFSDERIKTVDFILKAAYQVRSKDNIIQIDRLDDIELNDRTDIRSILALMENNLKFLQLFPKLAEILSNIPDEYSHEDLVKIAVSSKPKYADILEGFSSFLPYVLKAYSIIDPDYKTALSESLSLIGRTERDGKLFLHLAEELNKGYLFRKYANEYYRKFNPFLEPPSSLRFSYLNKFIQFIDKFYAIFNANSTKESKPRMGDLEYELDIKDYLEQIPIGTDILERNVKKCDIKKISKAYKQLFEYLIKKLFEFKFEIINEGLNRFNEEQEMPYLCANKYANSIFKLEDFMRSVIYEGFCMLSLRSWKRKRKKGSIHMSKRALEKSTRAAELFDIYTNHIIRLSKLNPFFGNIFLQYKPYKLYGNLDLVEEIVSFAEDACQISPNFDTEVFDEYMRYMNSTDKRTSPELTSKLLGIVREVSNYRHSKAIIKQKLLPQIEKQKNRRKIKLVIPDMMYVLQSQVELYRLVTDDKKYIKLQEFNEDDFIVNEIIPDLEIDRDLEFITLGCGSGKSEIKVAKAIINFQTRKRFHLYFTDISEKMLEETRVNLYENDRRALLHDEPKIESSEFVCNFLNPYEIRSFIERAIEPSIERRIYTILGGTAGNFPPEIRQRIYNNIEQVMRPDDMFIITCGVILDQERYGGESMANWIFFPLKILGIEPDQIEEFESGLENYRYEIEREDDKGRLAAYLTLNQDVYVNGITLNKGTKLQTLFSERLDTELFRKELSMFRLHEGHPVTIEDGSRAIAVCYKRD